MRSTSIRGASAASDENASPWMQCFSANPRLLVPFFISHHHHHHHPPTTTNTHRETAGTRLQRSPDIRGAALRHKVYSHLPKALHPRTRILVARCARSSNARAAHFSSLAIARSSKCDYRILTKAARVVSIRVTHGEQTESCKLCSACLPGHKSSSIGCRWKSDRAEAGPRLGYEHFNADKSRAAPPRGGV